MRLSSVEEPRARLLGDVAIDRDGELVRPRAGRAASLLALLALRPGRVVPTSELMTELWEEDEPQSGVAALYVHVSRLRRHLGPLGISITAGPIGYTMELREDAVDIAAFEAAVTAGETAAARGDLAATQLNIDAARDLWAGDEPFANAHPTPRLREERDRLVGIRFRLRVLEARHTLVRGDAHGAARAAADLTAADPLDEALWAFRIDAEHAAGNTARALSLFEEVRADLERTLGVDPGRVLRDAHTRVLRASTADPAAPLDAADIAAPPIVGRGSILARIDAAVHRAGMRRGTIVILEGDAGMGKTHLAEAAVARASARGFTTASTRSVDGAGVPPMWIWRRILTALIGDDALARVESADEDSAAPDELLRRRSQAIADRFVAGVTAPTLVVLDDVQWADAAALATLRMIGASIDDLPLVIVVTARTPEARRLDVASTLAFLARQSGAQRHRLAPFDAGEVRELASRVRGSLGTADAGILHRRTGGNPFFVHALLAQEAPLSSALPDSVAELVLVRLAILTPTEREIVEQAAVGGLEIDIALVAAATGSTPAEISTAMDAAVQAGLVRDGETGPAFVHSLARDAVVSALPRARSAELHRAYADACSELTPDAVEVLAFHRFAAAGGAPDLRAADACASAADAALASLAFDRAAMFRARCVQALPVGTDTDGRRASTLAQLCEEQRAAGDVQAAAATLRTAVRAARRVDDRALQIRVLGLLGGITLWNWRQFGEVDHASTVLIEELLRDTEDPLSPEDRAVLTGALAVELYYGDAGERARSTALARDAVDLATTTGDPSIMAQTFSNQVIALWRRNAEPDRRAVLDRWLSAPAPQGEIVARLHRAAVQLAFGDIDGFIDDSDRAGSLIPRLGRMELAAQRLAQEVGLAIMLGQLDSARNDLERTADTLARTSLWGGEWTRALQAFTLARIEGTQADIADEMISLAMRDEYRSLRWAALLCLAEAGRATEARAYQARWNLRRMPQDSNWNSAFEDVLAAETALHLGAPLLTDAYEVVRQNPAPVIVIGTALACWGPRADLLARIADRLGAHERARGHRADAAELTARIGDQLGAAPVWPGRVERATTARR
jgi:DNA-binding SARP family transcriptional activator/RecA/RadA recombinase